MDFSNRTCTGVCKKYRVSKPTGTSRYGSGQGHCQLCDSWIDHRGCHMKDGTPALEGTLGWFCNCCNYRVRQKPRNKQYKEKLRSENSQNVINKEDLLSADELIISKGQSAIIKQVVDFLPDLDETPEFSKIQEKIPFSLQHQLSDNWNSVRHFLEFATDYFEINKISCIVLFEKLVKHLNYVPQQNEFLYRYPIDKVWIQENFSSWEHFLELLNYDPWYRNTENKFKNKKSHYVDNYDENDLQENDYSKNIEEIQSANEIRDYFLKKFMNMDKTGNYSEYSLVDTYLILEKYISLIKDKNKLENLDIF